MHVQQFVLSERARTTILAAILILFDCTKNVHRCRQNDKSTTQLWFGTRKGSTAQPPAARDAETSSRYNNN